MTTAESDAIALLTRVRDSAGDVARQWEQAKALMERICRREYYGGWPSRQLKELVRRIDAADVTGNFGGVGTTGCRDITLLLIQIRDSGVVTGGGEPQSLTNAQKLALPANTAVGTQVQVTDAFVVSGAGTAAADGFYKVGAGDGLLVPHVGFVKTPADPDNPWTCTYFGGISLPHWVVGDDANGGMYGSDDDVDYPWQVTTWYQLQGDLPLPSLTHPAVQELVISGPSVESHWAVVP